MNRRELIGGLCMTAISQNTFWSQAVQLDSDWLPDTQVRNEWMQSAILDSPQQTKAEGALQLSWFPDSMYRLLSAISWYSNPGETKFAAVHVPIGFVTDLASIPRIFYSMLRPDGRYAYAAVIHDYLYWNQTITREDADTIFRLCMQDFKVPLVSITAIYNAVRSPAGQQAWNQNIQLKKSGEKRVLCKFPSDPTISWSTWKKSSENFQ